MIKPKVGDTLIYKSEADKSKFVNRLCSNARRHEDYYNNGFYVGALDDDGDICNSSIGGEIKVVTNELKYFKIKEKEMLKPDDIIEPKITALDGFKLLAMLGQCKGIVGCYSEIKKSLGVTINPLAHLRVGEELFNWNENSKLTLAALAQFKDPKQDKIDALEKTINDAAAELAKLKG